MPKNKRGKYLVDNRVQLALVRRIMLHWVGFIVLFLTMVLTVEVFLSDPGTPLVECAAVTIQKHILVLVVLAALLPMFLYDTIKLSHRFAGPVARLKNGLSSLADGRNVDEIKLRKSDFWIEMAADFNRVVRRLQPAANESESSSQSSPG